MKRGYSCEVIKLHGSVEIAPLMNLADCIVDLVSTGATLRANGLVEIETILESCAVLVVSRSAYAIRTRAIRDMLFRFRTALGA